MRDLLIEMSAGNLKVECALTDPASVYSSPESVLKDDALSTGEKVQILRQWEFDMAELAVATEEGMPDNEEDLTRPIRLALEKLQPYRNAQPVGPSKHHVSGEA